MKYLLALLSLVLFTGCKTVDGTSVADIDRIARVSKEATTLCTTELLKRHPEWAPQFQVAHDQLVALSMADSIGVDQILAIVSQLPVTELKSDDARLAFAGARLLISGIDLPEVNADKLAQVRPIVVAIVQGLEAAGVPASGSTKNQSAAIKALRSVK